MSCVIEEGDAPFHIRWFRDDKPLLHHVPSIETPIRSNGLRLTDFNSYSSILTIDQVIIIIIFSIFNFKKKWPSPNLRTN